MADKWWRKLVPFISLFEKKTEIRGEVDDVSEYYLGIPACESFYSEPEPDFSSLHARFAKAARKWQEKRAALHHG